MWPWLAISGGLGALTGAAQAYQQNRGDLGKTLLGGLAGGGLGLATGGLGLAAEQAVSRMAGQALPKLIGMAGEPGVVGAAARAAQPIAQPLAKAAPLAAGIGTQLLAGAALSPAANAVSNLMGQGVQTGVGAIGTQQNWQRNEQLQKAGLQQPQFQGPSAPDISGYAPGTLDLSNPLKGTQGSIAVAQELQRLALQNANLASNYNIQASDTMKQRDLQRQAAMASLKTQLGTQQGLILGGQQYGAQLANQMLADTGAIARTTYLY